MARYLGIDWSQDQLHVVAASSGRGGVRIERALVWPLPMPSTPAEAVGAGQQLQQRLKEARIPPALVLACLGRDRVIIQDIHFPAVPLHEEPAVVWFQAVKELTNRVDEVVIDYATFGDGVPTGERRALVLIVRRQLVLALQEMCKAAGLKLAGLTPRPFGLTACLDRVAGTTVLTPLPEPPGVAAILAVTKSWAEFSITSRGDLLLTRSLTPGAELVNEIRRNLAVHAGQAEGQPVRALYLTNGPETAALRERLHQTLELPVHVLDPFAGPGPADLQIPEMGGGFAGIVGLIHLHTGRQGLPANLAHPKEPRPPADHTRRRLLYAAGAAAALILVLVVWGTMAIASVNAKITALVKENQDLDIMLVDATKDSNHFKSLNAWSKQTIVWPDELYDLTDRFPNPDQVRLTAFSGDSLPVVPDQPGRLPKTKAYVAKIELQGVAGDSRLPLDQLCRNFDVDGHYRQSPLDIKGATREFHSAGFSVLWNIKKIDVGKRPPKDYTRELSELEEAENPTGQRGRNR